MLDPSPSSTAASETEPVDVQTDAVDGVSTPTLLLRAGRLWRVRWAETLTPGERWRVGATPSPAVAPVALEVSLRNGRWSLVETADGARGRG